MTHSKRDANERAILDALTDLGVWYYQMDRNAGFDLLLAFRGRLFVVEIKDPLQPPSARRLTTAEQFAVSDLALVGVDLPVCETLADVLRAINAT